MSIKVNTLYINEKIKIIKDKKFAWINVYTHDDERHIARGIFV